MFSDSAILAMNSNDKAGPKANLLRVHVRTWGMRRFLTIRRLGDRTLPCVTVRPISHFAVL